MNEITIQIANINFCIECKDEFEIVDYFKIFQNTNKEKNTCNVHYNVKKIEQSIFLENEPVYQNERMTVYRIGSVEYRQFPWWNDEANYPMTLKHDINQPDEYEFLLTAPQMEMFKNKLHFGTYLALERVMLDYDCFQLHASVIRVNGHGILFSAPSGTGKSTQADLWEKYENAEIINGDRGMIRKQEDGTFQVYGSPFAGSSQIMTTMSAPVKAVVVLSQAPHNKVCRLGVLKAFTKIYRVTTINAWDPEFVMKMTELLNQFVKRIPVYHLECRPDQDAVEVLKKEIFCGN